MGQIYGVVVSLFLGLLALTILGLIWFKKINLSGLLNEANGQASMSRFQLLIFTFVIALSLFGVTEYNKQFPDIPTGILTLLGISASTYAVGKGISYSSPEVMMGTAAGGDGDDTEEEETTDAQAHAQDAAAHAAAAKQAAEQAQAALSAQQAVAQQAANSAAQAKLAADQAKGPKS